MSTDTATFNKDVFGFIKKTYKQSVLTKVQQKQNSTTVDKLLADSLVKGYSVEKTANKIIAMLRLNP